VPSVPRADLSAAILIGGQARRLGGCFKPFLDVAGSTILDRQLAALGAAGIDDVLLVGRWPTETPAPRRVVADAIPNSGSLGALYTALLAGTTPAMLVVAGDMPFVSARLLTALATADARAVAVIPRNEGGLQPLCARYARAIAPHLKAEIDNGNLRVRNAVATLRALVVDEQALAAIDAERMMLSNVNTPADYEHAQRVRFGRDRA
jgi:molybdopterin-guanine dinucleotide biosynthesis protein A